MSHRLLNYSSYTTYFTGGVTTSHPFALRSFARYARRFALTPRSLSPTRDDDLCGHQNFTAPSVLNHCVVLDAIDATLLDGVAPDALVDFHTG